MNMVYQVITIGLFILYAVLEGHREARYIFYWQRTPKPENYNPHTLWWVQRIFIASIIYIEFLRWHNWMMDGLMMIALGCIFPFFHDGMYYKEFHKISPNNYPKGWWDESDTSTAEQEYTCRERIFLASFGLLVLIAVSIVEKLIEIIP